MNVAPKTEPLLSSLAASGVSLNANASVVPYAPPRSTGRIDLFLDANEGPAWPIDAGSIASQIDGDSLRRYPDARPLEALLAARFGVSESRVLVTAGGDEAIDRACRVCLGSERELVLPTPTFEMIARYATQAGATVINMPWWSGSYPTDAVLAAITPRTAMIALVSPNNPTGSVATPHDLTRVAAAAPQALILADLAYAEFADQDLTETALNIPNVLVVRTFSKAFGLAGLRVGYAIGSPDVIGAMRAAAGPYPVSVPSLAIAAEALRRSDVRGSASIERVRYEREQLSVLLAEFGVAPIPSQANFVLARFEDAAGVWLGLADAGIAVRRFAEGTELEQMLRITCPGDEAAFDRLCRSLRAVVAPFNAPLPTSPLRQPPSRKNPS